MLEHPHKTAEVWNSDLDLQIIKSEFDIWPNSYE